MSWTNRLANTEVHEIARDPSDPDVLWASTRNGVFKSVDNGVGWTQQTNSGLPSGNLSRTELAIAPSDPDTVYVLYNTPSDQFWRTTDGGANWTMMNPDACDGQCSYNMVIRVDATDPNTIYRGTVRIFGRWTAAPTGRSSRTSGAGSGGASGHAIDAGPPHQRGRVLRRERRRTVEERRRRRLLHQPQRQSERHPVLRDRNDADDPSRICGGAQDNSSLATTGDRGLERTGLHGRRFRLRHFDPRTATTSRMPRPTRIGRLSERLALG